MKLLLKTFCWCALVAALCWQFPATAKTAKRYLYVAEPGIRNYVEYGGVGIIVYDIDAGYKFVKRIPTWDVAPGQQPENVKGVVANAQNLPFVGDFKAITIVNPWIIH